MTETKTGTIATKGKRTRKASTGGQRSLRVGGRPLPMHEALSDHPLVPKVRNPSPSLTSRQQKFLQVLARHLVRDNPWLRNLVTVATDQHVATAPNPNSPFDDLNSLFEEWKTQIDPRGDYDWTGFCRELYREYLVAGDLFVRTRSRIGRPMESELAVPVQFELLPSEFVPMDFDRKIGDLDFICGIARGITGKPTHYAFCTEHPLETAVVNREIIIPAREVMHIAERRLGAPRGEVMLASALMRAIKAATLEDTELRRKMVSSLMSVFVTRPVDAGDDFELPSEEEVSGMIDSISLTPGGVFELPYGYTMTSFTPKDEPANFQSALKWQLMAVCAAIGILPHEVIFDYDFPERLGRYLNLIQERRASVVHRMLEFQFLNPLWRTFVDHAIASGRFTPPDDASPADLYRVDWEWDLTPLASFKQELEALQKAADDGLISRGYIQKTMFQLDPAKVDIERAREAAREKAVAAMAPQLEEEAAAALQAEMAVGD